MNEFIWSALPWVFMGVAVAVICANLGSKQTKKDKALAETIAVGIALGLIFGVALNYCGLWENHLYGFSIGPLWGVAMATIYAGHDNKNEDK